MLSWIPTDGSIIPAGECIIVPIMGIHNNPSTYPDPLIWNPHNFDPERVANRHNFSFIPFGFDPRTCLGKYHHIDGQTEINEAVKKFLSSGCYYSATSVGHFSVRKIFAPCSPSQSVHMSWLRTFDKYSCKKFYSRSLSSLIRRFCSLSLSVMFQSLSSINYFKWKTGPYLLQLYLFLQPFF